MSRYLHFGLAILGVAVGVALLSFYRTDANGQTAQFGGASLRIEYATTVEARKRGLSGRAALPDDYGMLFVFPKDGKHGFWMKDMLVPIDIFWLDDKGQVIHLTQDVATSTYPDVLYSTVPARYVLETSAGFAREHRITLGTKLVLKNIPNVSE